MKVLFTDHTVANGPSRKCNKYHNARYCLKNKRHLHDPIYCYAPISVSGSDVWLFALHSLLWQSISINGVEFSQRYSQIHLLHDIDETVNIYKVIPQSVVVSVQNEDFTCIHHFDRFPFGKLKECVLLLFYEID